MIAMFKRDVKPLGDVLQQFLRNEGLETPLLQKRIIDAWNQVVGDRIAGYKRFGAAIFW